MVERADPSNYYVLGGTEEEVNQFVANDLKIRSGLCPNGCGLLSWDGTFQECGKCGFVCNTRPELKAQ